MDNKKVCTKCNDEKTLDKFLFKNKAKGKYHSACAECYKAIRKKSYNKHKQTDRKRAKKNREKRRIWFKDLKSKLKCSRCPENHIACLEFHHTTDKYKEVSIMVGEGYSEKRILKEINKCIILCANCHRKEHHG